MNLKQILLATVAAAGMLPAATNAALVDRGGGFLYDDVLDVTWLQGTGGRGDGLGVTGQAILLCPHCYDGSSPNAGPVYTWNGVDVTGWRLPKRLLDPALDYDSELGYMFRANLGLTGALVPGGNRVDITTASGAVVLGVTQDVYWMAEEWVTPGGFGFLWSWEIDRSPQLSPLYQNNYGALWWVRDGDIAGVLQVPEPPALALAVLALLASVVAARNRKVD